MRRGQVGSFGRRRWKYPVRWPNPLFLPTQRCWKGQMPNLHACIRPAGETRGSSLCPEATPPAVCGSAHFLGSSFPPGKQQRGPSPRGETRRRRAGGRWRGCPRPTGTWDAPGAAGSPPHPRTLRAAPQPFSLTAPFAGCQRGPSEAEEGNRIFKCCP